MPINLELHENSDGTLDGRYKQGNKPNAASGGTPALAWSAPQGLSDGNTLTITTDGTNPFGATGPNVVMLIDPYKLPNGDMTLGDIDTGSGFVNFLDPDDVTVEDPSLVKFEVVSDARMGKAIKIGTSTTVATDPNGTSTAKVRCKHISSTKTFESRAYYWPQANQDNAIPYLTGTTTWQMKPIWKMADFDTSASETDFVLRDGVDDFYDPSDQFNNKIQIASNSLAGVTFTKQNSVVDTSDTYNRPFPEVYWLDSAWDQGSADGTTADGSAHVVQRRESMFMNNMSETGLILAVAAGATKVTNSFVYPGYVRGYSKPDNMNLLSADIYCAAGAGAHCRVYLTNNADYFAATKQAIQLVDAAQWSNGQIEINSLRTGIFQGDLTGCYLNIIGINNTQVGSVEL